MKRKGALVFCLLIAAGIANAQQWTIGLGYQYLYASQWDKAIQTYNFSRPFLSEPQPLLVHGTYLEGQFLFQSEKPLQSGIVLRHAYHRSRAENPDFIAKIHLHLVHLGYTLHYENEAKRNGFAMDFTLAAGVNALSRNINGESPLGDEDIQAAYGIGGSLHFTSSYKIHIGPGIVSPFVGVGYSPYQWSPLAEAVLNQTNTLSGKNHTDLLTFNIGLRVHLGKSKAER